MIPETENLLAKVSVRVSLRGMLRLILYADYYTMLVFSRDCSYDVLEPSTFNTVVEETVMDLIQTWKHY